MLSGKVWGTTELIFKNDNFEVHRITMKKNHYCSKHSHKHKHNMFYVESGYIAIRAWKNDYKLLDLTELKAGQKTNIPPGESHRFVAYEDSVAYEIYYSEPISGDITREDCGGINYKLLKEDSQ